MNRLHFSQLGLLALAVGLADIGSASSQTPRAPVRPATPVLQESRGELTCTVYALKDMCDDPNIGQWIAETIPQVIQPGSWSREDPSAPPREPPKSHRLCYYPQGRILVVYHTAAVQAEVAAFLDNLKKALPQEKDRPARMTAPRTDPALAPAAWATTCLSRPAEAAAVPPSTAYPVPPPLEHPKHLFHLIIRADGLSDLGPAVVREVTGAVVEEDTKDQPKSETAKGPRANPSVTFILRYEGEGIIDDTVADVLKEIYGPKNAGKNGGERSATPSCFGTIVGAAVGAAASSAPPPQPAPPPGGTRSTAPSPTPAPRPMPAEPTPPPDTPGPLR